MSIDYASKAASRGHLSRMAILAVPIGILSFPFLLHWTLETPLHGISKALAVPHDTFLQLLFYGWPSCGVLFCVVSWVRIELSKGSLRGAFFAIAGFVWAMFWLAAAILFGLLYKSAPASW